MIRQSGSVHLLPYHTTYQFGRWLLTFKEDGEGGARIKERWDGVERGAERNGSCHQIVPSLTSAGDESPA